MNVKKIALLGSTGSIGQSTLDVIIRHPGVFEIVALAAYKSVELLAQQARKYRPKYVCIVDPDSYEALKEALPDYEGELLSGEKELIELARLQGLDIVVNAVVGAAGLRASLATVESGTNLALANKESLVAGGLLFGPITQKTGAKILPIDSEHSGIWQVLMAGKFEEIKSLIITASGGPFRELPASEFEKITPEQALKHPTWQMGAKITIDSATLANKGLEVIEATQLFSVPVNQVKVVVHPQSIIHAMVEFIDSAIIAQLSNPDMKLPITYALFWPDRVESAFGQLDVHTLSDLTFEPPDLNRFPALRLAFEASATGGTAPAVFNAANEIAVEGFLARTVKFNEISDIIDRSLSECQITAEPNLEDILEADRRAREIARLTIGKTACL